MVWLWPWMLHPAKPGLALGHTASLAQIFCLPGEAKTLQPSFRGCVFLSPASFSRLALFALQEVPQDPSFQLSVSPTLR